MFHSDDEAEEEEDSDMAEYIVMVVSERISEVDSRKKRLLYSTRRLIAVGSSTTWFAKITVPRIGIPMQNQTPAHVNASIPRYLSTNQASRVCQRDQV